MKAASIGECMMEFRHRADGSYQLAYGGDTFNTAVYLRRLGIAVDYVTALGADPFSDAILALCREEGVGTEHIARVAGRNPGLYLIETDASGERSFHYWRDSAPARELFELPTASGVAEALQAFDLIHVSGVTLSLYSSRGLDRLFETLDRARAAGRRVVFDGNYRPRGWRDAAAARAAYDAMLRRVDIVLPTFDDERMLYGDASVEDCARRHLAAGIGEVVVKDGGRGCLLADGDGLRLIAAERVDPVDTTAAGDSFDAGYLAARLTGASADDAARAGHRVAATVIRHPGAIIPREAMPDMDGLLPRASQDAVT